VIAVEIFKEKIVAVMKVITAKKPWSIRDYCYNYINTVLMKTIERGTSSSSHTCVVVKGRRGGGEGGHPIYS
jgi:hypothetical protein